MPYFKAIVNPFNYIYNSAKPASKFSAFIIEGIIFANFLFINFIPKTKKFIVITSCHTHFCWSYGIQIWEIQKSVIYSLAFQINVGTNP